MQKTQKAVVITGASSGIGRACVLQMSKAGWQVFATVRKAEDRDRLEAAAIPGLTPVMMDVEDPASILAAAENVASRLSGLDGRANVAGIGMVGPVEYITPRDWETDIQHQCVRSDCGHPGISSLDPAEARANRKYQFGWRSHCNSVRRVTQCQQKCVRMLERYVGGSNCILLGFA